MILSLCTLPHVSSPLSLPHLSISLLSPLYSLPGLENISFAVAFSWHVCCWAVVTVEGLEGLLAFLGKADLPPCHHLILPCAFAPYPAAMPLALHAFPIWEMEWINMSQSRDLYIVLMAVCIVVSLVENPHTPPLLLFDTCGLTWPSLYFVGGHASRQASLSLKRHKI